MTHKVNRLLDANANRAREAMRVMEDAARFTLDDESLAGDLKTLRHEFATAIKSLGPIALDRDTPGDVGTAISTSAERSRASVAEVAVAAGKRLGEALRCCEEFGKLRSPKFAPRIEAIRYRAYDIEARLTAKLTLPDPSAWRVCALISESLCTHHGWLDVAEAAIKGGADCLQLREKELGDGELLARARLLVERAASRPGKRRASVVVNDRPDIALLAGADGVHVGQGDLSVDAVRRIAGRRLLVGVSTHNLAEAKRAVAAGADYCGVGAMFATTTKQRRPSGPAYLERFVRQFPQLPHLAIGGVTVDNIDELADAGARAVAVSSAVCGARHPAAVVRKLRRALNT